MNAGAFSHQKNFKSAEEALHLADYPAVEREEWSFCVVKKLDETKLGFLTILLTSLFEGNPVKEAKML